MSVTTRRERRERARRQQRRRGTEPSHGGGGGPSSLLIGAVVVVIAIAVILGLRGAGVLSLGPQASPTAAVTRPPIASDDPALGVKEADQGNSHVPTGQAVTYAKLPPTSGQHWSSVTAPLAPTKAGIYDAQLPFEATTHNLEHGGIVIVYNGLSADETTQLKDFIQRTLDTTPYKKVLLEPYPGLTDAKITATAWDWRLNLQGFDPTALTKFIQAHSDSRDAPEPGVPWA